MSGSIDNIIRKKRFYFFEKTPSFAQPEQPPPRRQSDKKIVMLVKKVIVNSPRQFHAWRGGSPGIERLGPKKRKPPSRRDGWVQPPRTFSIITRRWPLPRVAVAKRYDRGLPPFGLLLLFFLFRAAGLSLAQKIRSKNGFHFRFFFVRQYFFFLCTSTLAQCASLFVGLDVSRCTQKHFFFGGGGKG